MQRFLEQAATDPKVLAIKQTLYRTSGDSPIVDALVDAAEDGKQVLALVEIKARFDEQANIDWARKLEQAGCHVVYGLVGLKTHCKLSMVVRDDGDQLRRYVHIGTGNYHPKTARLYEDVGLLTTDPEVGEDVARLFNVLSGYSMETEYRRLLVAPHSVRSGLVDRIEREIENHRNGLPAGITFKCNSIVDEATIDCALPRLAGGRARRRLGARHLRAAPGRPGPVREHPRAQRPRPVPRALTRLPIRRTAATPRSGSARPTSCTATSTAGSRCWCASGARSTWRASGHCSASPSTRGRARGTSARTGRGPGSRPRSTALRSSTCRAR